MRSAIVQRKTGETDISLTLNLDGAGARRIDTGCGFFNHMMELFCFHGAFDLDIACVGDIQVDDHHTVEDIGIALGQAFAKALGDKRGITRYGNFLLPMDEALVLCAVDLSGRCALNFDVMIPRATVGSFDTELIKEFFLAFTRTLGCTLHFKSLAGENTHHIIEAVFKGFGRAMRQAVAIDAVRAHEAPSSKGMLE